MWAWQLVPVMPLLLHPSQTNMPLSQVLAVEKKRKGKEQTTPVGVRLMRSQVLYQAVLGYWLYHTHGGSACLLLFGTVDDSVSVAAPL